MRGVVATPHRQASEAGVEVLRDGGNAFDAIVAANAVLCVVYPHMTSIGGDLFALCWAAGEREPIGIAGAGRSGSGATIDAVRERGHERMPERGALAVTVPGTVQAWGRILDRFGRMGLGRVLEPAVSAARDGFVITPGLAASLIETAEWRLRESEQQRLYPPLQAGMLLRNPDLAAVLAEIGRAGWLGFYRGDVGAAIAAAVQKRDGFVTHEDMASHRGAEVEPLRMRYRDLDIYELPPPTQGLAAMGMLARFQQLRPDQLTPGPGFARELLRIRNEVYPLRDAYVTDPDFFEAPLDPFLQPVVEATEAAPVPDGGDTVYLCAADEEGNLVSLIQSVAYEFGSGVIAEGTGINLQNRGCYFSLDPAHVNRLEPRKRTMHTLIPALAGREGRPWAAFGSMGGDGQPQLQSQVLLQLVDHGLDPADAVAAPRLRVAAGGAPLIVEASYPGAGELARSELEVKLMPSSSLTLGHAHAIVVDGPGRWRGGADPRSDGAVLESAH
ncbi:MAG TPA: gamma-glutamyltransferase family protein [Candidatus Dormibacteraeota bacterium]